ncbi:MAG: LuxR family transcriptional regulator [Chthoniobacteraceae bacterium]|nr:LuxR family transcriptional regulator [Chthoniobacteraceae bacterium]
MESSGKARVLVADAEPISRRGLIHLINEDARLDACGETGSSREARMMCEKHQPDVLVLDPAMDCGDGFALLSELPRWASGARVVVFTALEDTLSVQRAFKAGAWGYVVRRDPAASVLAAIAGAARGERHVGPRVEQLLLERLACGALEMRNNDEAVLSQRELQIYRLIGAGHTSRDMADELCVSIKTVETHRQRIKGKLRLTTGAELQRRAVIFSSSDGRLVHGSV